MSKVTCHMFNNMVLSPIFKNYLQVLRRLLIPRQNIAGLEIKDAALRLARFEEDGTLKKAALVLEPGIIDEDGEVKDQARFVNSLRKLREEFQSDKEHLPVIAIIPSVLVYAKAFSVPQLAPGKLDQAAQLNLESISPIEFGTSYADWQLIGPREKDGGIEFLGAFVSRKPIDVYLKALAAAGFAPAAIEFPALAISRALKEYSSGADFIRPLVGVNVSSDGIDFFVLQNDNLYFEYFVPWKLVKEERVAAREILFSDFKNTILQELKKVSTFYGGHWGGSIEKLLLITQALEKEISDFIKANFPFAVTPVQLNQFPNTPSSWLTAIGSALRGRIPRSQDNLISLMAVGTEKGYLYTEIGFFIRAWRNVFLTTLGFLIILFIAADSFLARHLQSLKEQSQTAAALPGGEEVAKLQLQARSFNQLVEKTLLVKEQSISRSPFFAKLNGLGKRITFIRISLNAGQGSVLVTGKAPDEASAIDFKNTLIKEGFKEVSLPLSGLEANLDGTVSFTVTFKL